jgi:hypothetical protein
MDDGRRIAKGDTRGGRRAEAQPVREMRQERMSGGIGWAILEAGRCELGYAEHLEQGPRRSEEDERV